VLTKKSELNLNKKDVFPQVCIDHRRILTSHVFYTVWKAACIIRVVWLKVFTRARWSQSYTNNGFFNFVDASFHTGQNYTWLTAISSAIVSLHYLPRYLCSTITWRAPILWFRLSNTTRLHTKTTYSYNENPESLCYEQKRMSVLIWTETIIKYWFNYRSSSKLSSAAQTFAFRRPFCCSRRFS